MQTYPIGEKLDMKILNSQLELTNYLHSISPKSLGLRGNDKYILTSLSFYMSDKEIKGLFTCYPSHKELADKTGLGVSTIRKSLDQLETLGYISSRTRHDNSKVYTFLGFDNKKAEEVVLFIESENKRLAKKKELDKIRGSNLGRNRAKVLGCEQVVKSSPSCITAKLMLEQVTLALKSNVYYKDFQGYKDIYLNNNKDHNIESEDVIPEQVIQLDGFVTEPVLELPPDFEQPPIDYYNYMDFEDINREYY